MYFEKIHFDKCYQVTQERTSTAEDQNAAYARLAHKVTLLSLLQCICHEVLVL